MSITEEVKRLKKVFAEDIKQRLEDAQFACAHTEVGHWSGESAHSLMHPKRICLNCGLEEDGGWWCYSLDCSHWHPREGFAKPKLGPKEGRKFISMSFDEIMKQRP